MKSRTFSTDTRRLQPFSVPVYPVSPTSILHEIWNSARMRAGLTDEIRGKLTELFGDPEAELKERIEALELELKTLKKYAGQNVLDAAAAELIAIEDQRETARMTATSSAW